MSAFFEFSYFRTETVAANVTIRKDSRFVFGFAPQNIQNDAVFAELAQFSRSIAPAAGCVEMGDQAHELLLSDYPNTMLLQTAPVRMRGCTKIGLALRLLHRF